MVISYLNMLASDGTGFIFASTFLYSLNPVNEEICMEFIRKHGEPFIAAKKARIEFIPNMEA